MPLNLKTKYQLILFFFILIILGFFYLSSPPIDFPVGQTFEIKSGSSLEEISADFKKDKIIRSKNFFQFLVVLSGGEKRILFGDYLWAKKNNIFEVVKRLRKGLFEVPAIRVTIPEGYSNQEISNLLKIKINNFDQQKFITLAGNKEGYLFPDTYLFSPNASEEEMIKIMSENFNKKIDPFLIEINKSGSSLEEIIIMASLLEREASQLNDLQMISGILWNRIKKNIPLQVDASFVYLLGKGSATLTLEDLKYDSPYNTYLNKGLPQGPIGNPGVLSITAALNPIPSKYFFYLHDKNGIIHYAQNFEEHKRNKQKYLK